MDDLSQSRQVSWLQHLPLPSNWKEWLISRLPVVKTGDILGIEYADGRIGRMMLFAIPFLPTQIRDPRNYERVLARLLRATELAQQMGAKAIGFGGLLSTIGNGGMEVHKRARKKGLTITITNGGTFTAAATIDAVSQILAKKKIDISKETVAIIGASGFIGLPVAKNFAGKAGQVLVTDRNTARIREDFDPSSLRSPDDLSWLKGARIIISATSSPGYIIGLGKLEMIAHEAILADVAVPPDINEAILGKRPDLTLIRCGVIAFPGPIKVRINFHFGQSNQGKPYLPACMAETAMLAGFGEEERSRRTSLTSIRPKNIAWYQKVACDLGFEIIPSQLVEQEVFDGGS
jgi:predicted amino acid dehydrogenase